MKAESPDNRDNENIEEVDDYEADQNLLGFFKLLLEVDRRTDPNFYKKLAKEQQKAEAEKLERIKEPKENDR